MMSYDIRFVENIADIGGVKIAYYALKNKLNQDKLLDEVKRKEIFSG